MHTEERCDACRKQRLAGGMVMACAGLGVCGCKKHAQVDVSALATTVRCPEGRTSKGNFGKLVRFP
jgi:hypothetical protein